MSDLSWRPLRPHGSRPSHYREAAPRPPASPAPGYSRAPTPLRNSPIRPGPPLRQSSGGVGAPAPSGMAATSSNNASSDVVSASQSSSRRARSLDISGHAERLGPKVSEIAAELGIGEDEATLNVDPRRFLGSAHGYLLSVQRPLSVDAADSRVPGNGGCHGSESEFDSHRRRRGHDVGIVAEANGIDLNTVGVILVVVGIAGALISLFFWSTWGGFGGYRRDVVVEDRDRVVRG